MGSITGAVGADGGVRIPPLNAPTPSFRGSTTWVVTSIYDPNYQNSWTNQFGYLYVPFEYGWRAFTFQLNPGTGTTGPGVAVAGTNDLATAQNLGGNQWEQLPTASGAVFSNVMPLNGVTSRLCYINSGPWTAFKLSTGSGFPGNTGAFVYFGAAS